MISLIDGTITGTLSPVQSVNGTISGMGLVNGAVSQIYTVSGRITVGGAGDYPAYTGAYTVIPRVNAQTLDTALHLMTEDVNVTGVPYYQASNTSGDTVYIASEV